ncbi:MAG: HEAT repeat domain-containing protein [Deltaproteobacteria bacterium]|nr:MAG: HEAT repeat domain-containing protein [Deltaproteobacteria bacterium]
MIHRSLQRAWFGLVCLGVVWGGNINMVVAAEKKQPTASQPSAAKPSTVSAWIEKLVAPNPAVIEHATNKLVAFGKAAVPSLKKAMTDRRYTMRHHVAKVLFLLGPKASDALNSLNQAYQDQVLFQSMKKVRMSWFVPHLRARLLRAMASVGRNEKSALDVLKKARTDDNVFIRSTAIRALGRFFAKRPKDTIPLLLASLKDDKEASVQSLAAQSLGIVGKPLKVVLPILRKAMMDPEWQVQLGATIGLGHLGPKAYPAIPEIMRSLLGNHWMLRYYAVVALRKVGKAEPRVIMALRETVSNTSNHPKVKLEAQFALEVLAGKAARATSKPAASPTTKPAKQDKLPPGTDL